MLVGSGERDAMELIPRGEPPLYFKFPGLSRLGLPHVTTTRHCPGVAGWSDPGGPFRPELTPALAGAGLDLGRATWARQVHEAGVARGGIRGGFAGAADVLVGTEPGAPLAIFTADCLAILLWDPTARALAAAHVGWRGTVRGAGPAAVAALEELGAQPERLHAAIAPSIGPCCYEVDEPVIADFTRAYPSRWERWVRPARSGHWMLDLWQANQDLLMDVGVDAERIENPQLCTACHPEVFFSYRKRDRGRLATIAALP
jgi:polyphenol oxidase